ncbi:unnamed protein product [Strongylus vulgaris]|uniref:Uncharacterized protein n=1 Tax=Strongylus vulgaris TaxID=40348 RepID=A0A3P7LLP5_STRVU|nr:unnamed protein product [Strongylus vulgaris]
MMSLLLNVVTGSEERLNVCVCVCTREELQGGKLSVGGSAIDALRNDVSGFAPDEVLMHYSRRRTDSTFQS